MSDSTQSIADYLAQLLKDKKQIAAFPNVFLHVERLLDEGESSAPSTSAASTVPGSLAMPKITYMAHGLVNSCDGAKGWF
jgi:Homodimerisation region of STAR domain protein